MLQDALTREQIAIEASQDVNSTWSVGDPTPQPTHWAQPPPDFDPALLLASIHLMDPEDPGSATHSPADLQQGPLRGQGFSGSLADAPEAAEAADPAVDPSQILPPRGRGGGSPAQPGGGQGGSLGSHRRRGSRQQLRPASAAQQAETSESAPDLQQRPNRAPSAPAPSAPAQQAQVSIPKETSDLESRQGGWLASAAAPRGRLGARGARKLAAAAKRSNDGAGRSPGIQSWQLSSRTCTVGLTGFSMGFWSSGFWT